MKKFNIICVILMLIMTACIIYNFMVIETGTNPIYHKGMLVLDGILLGMAIGECWMGNMIVGHKCNFDNKEDE